MLKPKKKFLNQKKQMLKPKNKLFKTKFKCLNQIQMLKPQTEKKN